MPARGSEAESHVASGSVVAAADMNLLAMMPFLQTCTAVVVVVVGTLRWRMGAGSRSTTQMEEKVVAVVVGKNETAAATGNMGCCSYSCYCCLMTC